MVCRICLYLRQTILLHNDKIYRIIPLIVKNSSSTGSIYAAYIRIQDGSFGPFPVFTSF